jgi:hypothetical protein
MGYTVRSCVERKKGREGGREEGEKEERHWGEVRKIERKRN